MPFGMKTTNIGVIVNFDVVYQEVIAPAIKETGLEPLRADEEMAGGIIHKPMFERLILCEYAVADLTTANANVFYELGVRHAVRPWCTVLLFAEGGGQLPFDVAPLRAMHYTLGAGGIPSNVSNVKAELIKRLHKAKQDQNSGVDSPIYQLVEGFPEIDHTKTDVFRDRVSYSSHIKGEITAARKQGKDALIKVEQQLGDIQTLESGVVIDLFLSYRSVKAWSEMVNLVTHMSPPQLS